LEVNNPKYKKQGVHVVSCIFTVEKGSVRVLLIKRKNEPYKDMWGLVGGALYNDEDLEDGLKREVFEKTGIQDIELKLCNVFGRVDRSPVMRMVGISYLGVLDSNRVRVLKDTMKTSDADWVEIDKIPSLAYDHNEVLNDALEKLKVEILRSDILKSLFPDGFTFPEIQKAYESILKRTFDRRNFRKKLLSLDLIEDTQKEVTFEGRKPAKLYRFKKNIRGNKNVF